MKILLVPAFDSGLGGGHLTRCMKLALGLRSVNRQAFLYAPEKAGDMQDFFKSTGFNSQWRITEKELDSTADDIDFIVLDRFQTPQDELLYWKKFAPVIGIDEGGRYRNNFSFLIDILIPKNFMKPSANITSTALLSFPSRNNLIQKKTDGKIKILVSFGHEDSANLGKKTTRALSSIDTGNLDITLLHGSLNKSAIEKTNENLKILNVIPNLAEHLHEYDLIITHYGITSYEALYAGTPVLLLSPTKYHEKLAKKAGFKIIKKNSITFNNLLKKKINKLQELDNHCKILAKKNHLNGENERLTDLINRITPQVNLKCPVCGYCNLSNAKSISRFSRFPRFNDRTYFRCIKCGIIYMDRMNPAPVEYEKEYFFESYKKQYGKTYIEDFPNLKKMAKRRLEIIQKLQITKNVKQNAPLLLDIGCAYGPFLIEAKEKGYSPFGIDPSDDAVHYVNRQLGIPAIQGFFPKDLLNHQPEHPHGSSQNSQSMQIIPSPLTPASFSVITLWYVIEHLRDCKAALAEIKNLLKPQGILAFSTPSFSGVSGRYSKSKFLEKSPADHYTVWSPSSCKKALALSGFKVKKIVSTGHHPDRFPVISKFAKSKKSPLYWLLYAISRIFCLGDTFEIYAVKN